MTATQTVPSPRTTASILAPDFAERSVWWDAMPESPLPNPSLKASVDVAIVGAGVTGLNAALELIRAGKSVAVFDAGQAGFGASSRNTGFLGRFLKKSFGELLKAYGPEKAVAYYSELYEALNVSMKDVIARERIDCNFDVCGRVVLARSHSQLNGVVDEFKLRQQYLGEDIKILDQQELQEEIKCSNIFSGGVLIPDMASIHPGKYHQGLLMAAAKLGVSIFNNVRVGAISKQALGFDVETAQGTIKARDVIVATNGYTGADLQWFARRLVPFQGFAIATEEISPQRLKRLFPTGRSYTDADFDTMAIRVSPDGKRIITSGRTGRALPLVEKAKLLRQDLIAVFPELEDVKVSFAWSGYCSAPLDTMPKVGQRADGVWYSTGYTFMGMPQGSYFGRKVAFQLLGDAAGKTAYSRLRFKSSPLYNGKPWFLSTYMKLMRVKDSWGNR